MRSQIKLGVLAFTVVLLVLLLASCVSKDNRVYPLAQPGTDSEQAEETQQADSLLPGIDSGLEDDTAELDDLEDLDTQSKDIFSDTELTDLILE